jgi:NADH-quinone oxidoreductase subunit I
MGAAGTYFRHIREAVVTIFDGMAVTASHFIRKPYTIQYPDRISVRVQDTLPFRYRGILDVDLEICTGCLACDRACPIDCIAIAIEKNAQTREILISQFDIDLAKCMYCGLCSEPCPTGAIHHTTEFEGADYSLESLIRRFVPEPIVAYKPKKGPEPDPGVAKLLELGMKYVDEWAQPGSDKPAPAATTAAPSARPAPPKPAPAAPTVRPAATAAPRLNLPAGAAGSPPTPAATPKPAMLRPLALKTPVAPGGQGSDASPTRTSAPASPAAAGEPAAASTAPATDDKGDKQG